MGGGGGGLAEKIKFIILMFPDGTTPLSPPRTPSKSKF
jgi:hypothetical protein